MRKHKFVCVCVCVVCLDVCLYASLYDHHTHIFALSISIFDSVLFSWLFYMYTCIIIVYFNLIRLFLLHFSALYNEKNVQSLIFAVKSSGIIKGKEKLQFIRLNPERYEGKKSQIATADKVINYIFVWIQLNSKTTNKHIYILVYINKQIVLWLSIENSTVCISTICFSTPIGSEEKFR